MITEKEQRAVALFERVTEVTGQEEADSILAELVEISMMHHGFAHEEAVRRTKENIGYHAGYFSNEIRERVERLFDCEHPFFGRIAIKGPPTVSEAFKMGQEFGAKLRRQREEN